VISYFYAIKKVIGQGDVKFGGNNGAIEIKTRLIWEEDINFSSKFYIIAIRKAKD